MAISFTSSIKSRLQREVTELEQTLTQQRSKRARAEAKIKQLERGVKLSHSATDLSSKLTQLNKLTGQLAEGKRKETELARQLRLKQAELKELQAKPAVDS
ncbi:hypothetical protein ACFO9Q_00470 [Paenibacillus sp. GCM10023252]|uniref:hypothetical protein n=1 Tax=Paenibacillus sp. GCM10023252 TaxID=3252649 RepID=UPI0036137E85